MDTMGSMGHMSPMGPMGPMGHMAPMMPLPHPGAMMMGRRGFGMPAMPTARGRAGVLVARAAMQVQSKLWPYRCLILQYQCHGCMAASLLETSEPDCSILDRMGSMTIILINIFRIICLYFGIDLTLSHACTFSGKVSPSRNWSAWRSPRCSPWRDPWCDPW